MIPPPILDPTLAGHSTKSILCAKISELRNSAATFKEIIYSHQTPPLTLFLSPHAREKEQSVKMAPANLPSIFNATSSDIEQLLAAQSHIGSKKYEMMLSRT